MVSTVGRIRRLTAEGLNNDFEREARARVAYYASRPEQIERRLRELDDEWDIERVIELEVAGTVFTGFFLGITLSKKWFLLPAIASAMLLLHSARGTYPLLPLLRRLGFRSANEIARERYALKAVRGDFEGVSESEEQKRVQTAFDAAQPSGPSAQRPYVRSV
ncbi:MAG TPA: hypothetical protein VLT36_11815 [Candidatus Dormibacteraeota bacterium]|nr:hypothetical protein [Candidatus Dormibacteraeota bacterium]